MGPLPNVQWPSPSGHPKLNTVGSHRSSWRRLQLGLGLTAALAAVGCGHQSDYGGVDISIAPLSRTLRGEKLMQRSYAAVVTVETDIGRGMGFVVDPAGYIVTNRHVVEDADHLEGVVFPTIDPEHVYESVRIEYIDPVRDLALLKVNAKEPLPFLPLATRHVEPVSRYLSQADPIVLLERDGDKRVNPGLIVRRGEINELAAFNPAAGPGAFVGVSADVVQGQSGGPVLDAQGRAVGIVTWTWRDRVGGYAIPIAEATRMMAERPQIETGIEHEHRVESRVRTFLDAIARGDADIARRLTSPSHARDVRGVALSKLTGDGSDVDPKALQWFIAALEELTSADPDNDAEVSAAFGRLQELVASTGDVTMRNALGLKDEAASSQIVAFFHELGQAYLAARMFGDQEPTEAMGAAMRRLRTVDAARTFALARQSGTLRDRELMVERIDVVPGAYKPTAVVGVASRTGGPGGGPERLAVHLRLEWGDWYVAEVRRAALSEAG